MVKRILVFCLIADLLLVSACTKKTKTMQVVFSGPLSDSLYVEILLTDTDEIVGMDFNIVYQSQDWLFQKITESSDSLIVTPTDNVIRCIYESENGEKLAKRVLTVEFSRCGKPINTSGVYVEINECYAAGSEQRDIPCKIEYMQKNG